MKTILNPNIEKKDFSQTFGKTIHTTENYLFSYANSDTPDGILSGIVYAFDLYTGEKKYSIQNPNAIGSGESDYFGTAIASYGDFLAIGAYGEGLDSSKFQGAVYIFNIHTGILLDTILAPSNLGLEISFGKSIAMNSHYLAISAYQADTISPVYLRSGGVFLYHYVTEDKEWQFVRKIENPNAAATPYNDFFGTVLEMNSTLLAVSAYGESSNLGKVYVFDMSSGTPIWTIDKPAGSETNSFGGSIALSETHLAISDRVRLITQRGVVYIYNIASKSLVRTIENPDAGGATSATEDNFGYAIDISDTHLLVGFSGYSSYSGRAYLYNISTGGVVHTLNNPNITGSTASDRFGRDLKLQGVRIFCAATGEDTEVGNDMGVVYAFSVTTGQRLYTVKNPAEYGTSTDDDFGRTIVASEKYTAIAAPSEFNDAEDNDGVVYIYDTKTLALLFSIRPPEASGTVLAERYFGDHMAIHENNLLIQSWLQLINTNVYLYDLDTREFKHTFVNPIRDGVRADHYGLGLAISEDYIAIGAPRENMGDSKGGVVEIYNATTLSFIRLIENPVPSPAAYFGAKLKLVGDKIIISSPGAPIVSPPNLQVYVGAVYVYNVVTGALLKTIENPQTSKTISVIREFENPSNINYDNYGSIVAMCDDYIAVTSAMEVDTVTGAKGKVHVFNVKTKECLYTIINPGSDGSESSNMFGTALAMSEKWLAIGDPSAVVNGTIYCGKVYFYNLKTGSFDHSINPYELRGNDSGAIHDLFGYSLSIATYMAGYDDIVLIGAPGTESGVTDDSGVAYLYNIGQRSLVRTYENPSAPQGSGFGESVHRSVSGPFDYDCIMAKGIDGVAEKVFVYENGGLSYTAESPTLTKDQFGESMCVFGSNLYISAPNADAGKGRIYIFEEFESLIQTITNPNAAGTTDQFGKQIFPTLGGIVVSAPGASLGEGKIYRLTTLDGSVIDTIQNPMEGVKTDTFFGRSFVFHQNTIVASSKGHVFLIDVPNSNLDIFGEHMSVSGKYLAIGTPGQNFLWSDFEVNIPKIHIYDVDTFELLWTVESPDGRSRLYSDGVFVDANEQSFIPFGKSFEITDTQLFVGAGAATSNGNPYSGVIYIYRLSDLSITGIIHNPDRSAKAVGDFFGNALTLHNDYILVSSMADDDSGLLSGKAFAYFKNNETFDGPRTIRTAMILDNFSNTELNILFNKVKDIVTMIEDRLIKIAKTVSQICYREKTIFDFAGDVNVSKISDKSVLTVYAQTLQSIIDEIADLSELYTFETGQKVNFYNLSATLDFSKVTPTMQTELLEISSFAVFTSSISKEIQSLVKALEYSMSSLFAASDIIDISKKRITALMRSFIAEKKSALLAQRAFEDAIYVLEKASGDGTSLDDFLKMTTQKKEDYLNEQYY